MSKRIYLDYASLAPIDPRVSREMKRYSGGEYANPSSLYKEGVAAKKALEAGRAYLGAFIHAHRDEIVFTSGGTEANALAIEGVLKAAHRKVIARPHLIISNVEHSTVMENAIIAERIGCEVTRLAVDRNGLVSLDDLKAAIKPSTTLISIMAVNNEVGTIQPIREMAKVIRQWKKGTGIVSAPYPLFHADASQGLLYQDLNVEQLGVDLLALDSSKAYGPRGVGALFVRRGTPIEPIIFGGGQERGLRSGTENLPGIMGFAKALEIAAAERERETERIRSLKGYFLAGLKKIRPDIRVNPEVKDNITISPHILSVSIPGIDNELFVLRLDACGVAVSTKSSCLRDADESYVLKAIGIDSRTAVRFSFGRSTRRPDLNKALVAVAKALKV